MIGYNREHLFHLHYNPNLNDMNRFFVCFFACALLASSAISDPTTAPACQANCRSEYRICVRRPSPDILLCREILSMCLPKCCDDAYDICTGFGSGCDGKCEEYCVNERNKCLMNI